MLKFGKYYLFLILFVSISLACNAGKLIYEVSLNSEVNTMSWQYLKQGLKEASDVNSDIIILHINTYGGAVDCADSIRTAILNHKTPIYAFINNNAASAGALIAIACDSIYMRAGANIGAATVVDGTGSQLPDKYQSYMRSMIRSTAESHGKVSRVTESGDTLVDWLRNPIIAESMVDAKTVASMIGDDSTRVVTLTAQEAVKYGFCEGIADSKDHIIKEYLKIDDYKIVKYEPTIWDSLLGFLANPAFQAILIMVMIGGVYFELQTPGMGFPSAASIIAAVLYFTPLYLTGSAADWEIVIFVVGIIALVLEIFVIPGFGVVGIGGIVLIFTSLLLAVLNNTAFSLDGIDAGDVYLAIGTVLFGFFLGVGLIVYLSHKIGSKNGFFKHTALHLEQRTEDGYIGVPTDLAQYVGREAVTSTVLRPAGKILIDETEFDAVSINGFIDPGNVVKVVRVENAQLYVRLK